ncbi:MAG: zinc ribbon domain-containing protein [Halioglobus sp.]|nr:zinc ribbon domain-containing protein [Halioglobus sp.]
MRIIPQDLWEAAKSRQKDLDAKPSGLWHRNRPRYLLSGLLRCGVCGGGYAKINASHYGCAASKNKGESVCANRKTIKREVLESKILSALETHLMRDDLLKIFCEEYTRALNALRRAQDSALGDAKAEKEKLSKERANILKAIREGIGAALVRDDLERIAARLDALEDQISQGSTDPRPLLHPAMARRYREEVAALRETLSRSGGQGEAAGHLRDLIEKIVLTPSPGREDLQIDLYGDLAGILSMATDKTGHQKRERLRNAVNDNASEPSKIVLVAGAGFEPTTFGL